MEASKGMFGPMCRTKSRMLTVWLQNLAFAKDEAKFSVKKVKNKLTGGLSGREPDVETELG